MTVYVFRSRGTTEVYGRNSMLGHVTDAILKSHPDIVIEDVVHSASISIDNATRDPLAPSGANCANQIVTWLNQRVARLRTEDRFIVLGYSLGAVGVTRWLKQWRDDGRCLMVGNIANPSRKETTSYGLPFTPGAYGLYATQGTGTVDNTPSSRIPLYEIANPLDVMTTCYRVSPLHAFSGPVMAFSFSKPTDLVQDLINGGIDGILRNVANVGNWFQARWWTWAGELNAFVAGGTHTTAYAVKSWRDSANKPVSGIDLLARVASWKISTVKVAA